MWTWHEPGVVHVAGFIFSILFVEWETVPPCTVFGGVLFYLLPPPGERTDLRGVYVTRIARFHGLIDIEPADMEAVYPIRLDSRTMHGMHIVQRFPHLGLRFALEKGVIWQPGPNDLHYRDDDPMPQPQPQHPHDQPLQPPPHGEGEPHQDVPHQHPERIYRAVRLPARVEAMLQGIADSTQQLIQQQAHMQQVEHSQRLAHTSEQLTRRLDRLEDLILWHVHVELRHAQGEGIQLPAVPQPRDYPPPPPPPS
ncbi:hypothetical protein E3N88_08522 [Mikania micrantha]|uniref:Uncharacterized protein n=1 Tax=Mikania micrantha TaxID=192012 RepID=A0A5N6PIQ0_9ASTR|nr:hypothetical protein E3N88_08522 [Mikania micrantha]